MKTMGVSDKTKSGKKNILDAQALLDSAGVARSAFSDSFLSHMLARNVRIEEDLADQLFNSTEKRLARCLLLLAGYGEDAPPQKALPKISQETLAEMIGTTRSPVNLFMNKFKKMGFIKHRGDLHIEPSLLTVVLGISTNPCAALG
jgi:CRP/FNR family transcriptional regulator, cyclic AMP receptor protein